MKTLGLTAFIFVFFSTNGWAYEPIPIQNFSDLATSLGFQPYYSGNKKSARKIKVAILDKSFDEFTAEEMKSLPEPTLYHPGKIKPPQEISSSDHGIAMAQLFAAFTTGNGKSLNLMPEFHIYNVYGFSNFQDAIDDVIAQKMDVVLYPEVWDYGGNGDGSGFINSEVRRATDAGVIWINAAGNFADRIYSAAITNAPVTSIKNTPMNSENSGSESEPPMVTDPLVQLPNRDSTLQIICEKKNNPQKMCRIRVVLSWNDFKDNTEKGTNKDLNLELTGLMNESYYVLQTSSLVQSPDPKEKRPGYSKYPREIIEAEVPLGSYYLRVRNHSQNFTKSDRLRLIVDGEFISVPTHQTNESLLYPADTPSVITVGAMDSDRSSYSRNLQKPDLLAPSLIWLGEHEAYMGSSNAATIVAAGLTVLKSLHPEMSRDELLRAVTKSKYLQAPGSGLSTDFMNFTYTGPGCFRKADISLADLPAHISQFLEHDGVLVETSLGARIMVDFDPFQLTPNLSRLQFNDMLTLTPSGYKVYRRNQLGLPNTTAEIFQRPVNAGLCPAESVNGSVGDAFQMPRIDSIE